MKRWNYPKINKELAHILAEECGVSDFVAEILVGRGMTTPAQAQPLLDMDLELESPFAIKDMDRAAQRVQQAVDAGEPIVIYGDYDCDGVTSTTILYTYLSLLGAEVSYYIPKRAEEGYGMNKQAVERLAQNGAKLLITVDNGISAVEEIALANSLGMTVVVTDHHQAGEVLPDAYAIVDPHRKDCPSTFKALAGVGVAFKLIAAMEGGDCESVLEQFAEIVCIGTVADVVPLVGENRRIVQTGLSMLAQSDNIGLNALLEAAALNPQGITSQNIAFGIAPRINAAGRMQDAALAVKLLLSDDEEEAAQLAAELNHLNEERKTQEEGILLDIERQIGEQPGCLNDRVLTFYGDGWHHGIIGIVSSKLLEQYGKPNLLMALNGEELVGSARSVDRFSLYQALCACSDCLTRFGGHTQAAGFSMDFAKYMAFKQQLEQYAAEHYKVMPAFQYTADKEILPRELSVENIESVSVLEPFGAQNQQPLYLLRNAVIEGITPVSENKHLRLKLDFGGVSMTAMCFRTSTQSFPHRVGDKVDFLGNITINRYNGREYLSVVVKDIRLAGFVQDNYFNAKTYYEMFRRGEKLSPAVFKKMTPERSDIALVYRVLKQRGGYDGDVDVLYSAFANEGLNYSKYRLILDVLSDVGLLAVSPLLNQITLCSVEGKVDLEAAETLKTLRQLAG